MKVAEGWNDIPAGVENAARALNEGIFMRGDLARAVKKRDFKGTAWALALFSILLFGYVWAHMSVVRLGYEVQGLKSEKRRLTNESYYLQYRLYEVRSLTRVEQTARSLGMVTPKTDQIVILEEPGKRLPSWLAWNNGVWTSFTDSHRGSAPMYPEAKSSAGSSASKGKTP